MNDDDGEGFPWGCAILGLSAGLVLVLGWLALGWLALP